MMKPALKFPTVFVLSLLLIFSVSCKKDQNSIDPPVLDSGYEAEEAAVIMTLAAIAYTAEIHGVQMINDSIQYLLSDSTLATKGEWELAWGPGVDQYNTNLVYVAKNNTTHPASYAIAIRGTSIGSLVDILENAKVFTLVPFKYGIEGDSIAIGSMEGLDILLSTRDPITDHTLAEFLTQIAGVEKKKMYITGHSQGGALAPLLSYWFITSSGVVDDFNLETYAFAGPSVSNGIFKDHFFNSLPTTADFHMVANSLDVIPYFWARYDSLITGHIPTRVPIEYRIATTIVTDEFKLKNISYVQLDNQIDIGHYPPIDNLNQIHPSDTLRWFNHWMKVEHVHNNYLRLLGAKPI